MSDATSSTTGRFQVGATGRWSGTLEREDGAKVGIANIASATIWLRDPVSGQDIRGTSASPQSIWNSGAGINDFSFADTTVDDVAVTTIGWDVQIADVALRNSLLAREEHVADIVVTFSQDGVTKKTRHVVRLRCVDTPGLCTFDDVRVALSDLNEDTSRISIEDSIEAFSALAEKRSLRRFRKTTVANPETEIFSIVGYERTLRLRRYPVASVTSIKEDYDGNFAAVQAYDATDYYVDAERGTITRRGSAWIMGDGNLQVVYAGGLFSDPAEVPSDLRWAAVQQVVHWWKFRDKLGIISISVPGSSVTQYSQAPLLPAVEEVLRLYRRPRHW